MILKQFWTKSTYKSTSYKKSYLKKTFNSFDVGSSESIQKYLLTEDSLNNILVKTDTLNFFTKREEAYNNAVIKMKGFENLKNPILQLSKEDKVKFSYPIVSALLTIKQLPLGEYTLSLLLDNNNNGKWDTGDYWKKIQPEKVVARKKPINIRANWDNEMNLILKP